MTDGEGTSGSEMLKTREKLRNVTLGSEDSAQRDHAGASDSLSGDQKLEILINKVINNEAPLHKAWWKPSKLEAEVDAMTPTLKTFAEVSRPTRDILSRRDPQRSRWSTRRPTVTGFSREATQTWRGRCGRTITVRSKLSGTS